MAKRKRKESNDVDRISQLPDNVLDKILTSLPISEAAKTAVLSRYWKCGWQHISILTFDDYYFGEMFRNAGSENLMLTICQILLLHMGPIDGFTLSIQWLRTGVEISPMIRFLSEKKVKHLEINFQHFRDIYSIPPYSRDYNILPSYLYSCYQLCTLDLQGCELNLPCSFEGFNHLINLKLLNVLIKSDFGMLITNCPLLQELYLEDCQFNEASSINIIAPNLRSFIYWACEPHICLLSAPLLYELAIQDYFIGIYKKTKVYQRGGRNIITQKENIDRLKKTHLDEFFSAVPALRKLTVNDTFLKTLEVRDPSSEASQPPNCLQQLKELDVRDFCCAEFMDSVFGLIRISPNLEQFSARMEYHADACLEPISPSKILKPGLSCNRLQTVELSDFAGTNPEMEFVKFLLLNSPQLKTMTIQKRLIRKGSNSAEREKRLQILTQMLRFQRASAVADINFC